MSSKANRQLCPQSFLQHSKILVRIVSVLTILGMLLFFRSPVYSCNGRYITSFYFEKDGEPHDEPVDFTINCYGYYIDSSDPVHHRLLHLGEVPERVFSWSATCPHYGCEIDGPYIDPYVYIEYCDCEGVTEGQQFIIEKYSSSPVDFSECELVGSVPWLFSTRCELTFDIPTSTELTDSDTQGEPTDSDGNGETTDSDTDGGNDGGCFITILLRQ